MSRMQDQIVELEDNRLAFSAQLISLCNGTNDLNESLQQQGALLEIAKSQLAQLLVEHRRTHAIVNPSLKTPLELEVAAIEKRNANQLLVDGLTVLARQDQTLALALEKHMADAGVHPPNGEGDEND